ncbi:MAG: MotA/TolQ/ExbB proton channel family protein [Pirellulaceae bacterium]
MRGADRRSLLGVMGGLGWPLLIGLALTSVFYAMVLQGPLNSQITLRYFAAHPVSFFATSMFLVGLAALTLKLADVLFQSAAMRNIRLAARQAGATSQEECRQLLEQLQDMPRRCRESHLGVRLREALAFIERRGSAAGLDEELKYLADMGEARQQESFALVRIIIWATPMLGFLGTVIGITHALGDLDAELLATDPKSAMQGLLAGLYIAFDTTALALSLSIVLMFLQFLVDRFESQLLSMVDEQTNEEVLERFPEEHTSADPHLAAVQRMSGAVIKTAEKLVQEQTDHWKSTLSEASVQWCHLLEASGASVQTTLTNSLEDSLNKLADRLMRAEQEAEGRLRARWEQWQTALSDNARLLHSQQSEMTRQGEIMSQVLQATGDVIKLEQVLNDNLRVLAGAKNFEDTVMSLSAAIHLLNTRLGEPYRGPGPVDLDTTGSQGRAA